ncbi:MAG: flavodoxin family protein [Candidatus Hodarchaeota archaeon]
MSKVLIVYYSRSGNTEKMAKLIAKAIEKENVEVTCKKVGDTDPEELLDVDGVVIGSPTYYGTMAAEIKKFIDESVKYHGKLDGKVGAAFSSAAITGHETTCISILEALLIHGMIIQGDPDGCHYGATSIGEPKDRETQWCQKFGKRVAKLVNLICEKSN